MNVLFFDPSDFNQLRDDFNRVNNPMNTLPDGQPVLVLSCGRFGFVLHSEPERDLFHVQLDSGFVVSAGFSGLLVIPNN